MKQASFLDVVKTVLSGLIGIRRLADHENASVNPVHVIIAAVVLLVLLVFALITVVRMVTS
ncbi:MAG: DUF2970 domain-containing protein [Burkholderiales bacterium]